MARRAALAVRQRRRARLRRSSLAASAVFARCSSSSTARIRCGPIATPCVYVFGNAYGFSELFVRMTPLVLTAVAVGAAGPARPHQRRRRRAALHGRLARDRRRAALRRLPAWLLLPLMTALGFVGGALWALMPGLLRAAKLVNETISTLLLNYVAPLIVSYFIFGPWRSSESASYPQSPAFVDAARLPSFPAPASTRAPLRPRLPGALRLRHDAPAGAWRCARSAAIRGSARLGIPVSAYMVAAWRRPAASPGSPAWPKCARSRAGSCREISPGYGYMGFLVAWLAGGGAVASS